MQKDNVADNSTRIRPSKLEIYGFWGLLKLSFDLIKTKIILKNVRIIRFPIQIRGKKYIDFGNNNTFGTGCRIEAYPYKRRNTLIQFGDNIEINDFVHITGVESVIIGNNVLMASKIYISDTNHGSYKGDENDSHPDTIAGKRLALGSPVIIEENVWIGESVSILAGSHIGKCSIIGSNSVVSGNIPAYTIAVGVPAKPIKEYDFEKKRWVKIK
jgi:lipopolysaccharide O-acetyltransferase